jgi:CRP-like cAMP-binding protein
MRKASVEALSAVTSTAFYRKGAKLFVAGEPARGIFILCSGRVRLSTSSVDGKKLILRLSAAGEVLGLPANVTGACYELTAEVLEPAQSNFIPRNDFLTFLKDNGEAALRVAQQLGETYRMAIVKMCAFGLSHSAGEKLARFLLQLVGDFPEERASAVEANADLRRDRTDDRVVPGNRNTFACRLPQESVAASRWINTDRKKQVCVRKIRKRRRVLVIGRTPP